MQRGLQSPYILRWFNLESLPVFLILAHISFVLSYFVTNYGTEHTGLQEKVKRFLPKRIRLLSVECSSRELPCKWIYKSSPPNRLGSTTQTSDRIPYFQSTLGGLGNDGGWFGKSRLAHCPPLRRCFELWH